MSLVHVYVGSENPVKLQAVKQAFDQLYPGQEVSVFSTKAGPGINDWRSSHSIGQPYGLEQTRQGAVNRMRGSFQMAEQSRNNSVVSKVFAVGLENGLVPPSEVNKQGQKWFDICVTAVVDLADSKEIVHYGNFVESPFSCPEDASPVAFDTAVQAYEAEIMPLIRSGVDLYSKWTAGYPNGPLSRGHFLIQSLLASHAERQLLLRANNILDRCVEYGMAASAGPRYRHMLWTRDLAYMSKAYLKRGYEVELLQAVRKLTAAQCSIRIQHDSGYGLFDRFGQIPIVLVAPEDELRFLKQRIVGDDTDPFWYLQLRTYCQKHHPEQATRFPQIPRDTVDAWAEFYTQLTAFRTQLKDEQAPNASFALKAYMNGTLWNLTPGTRDSEIQYLRSVLAFNASTVQEFTVPIARALRFIYTNVLDLKDGLPYGADSRDIFADLMVDAKLLSNAVFWVQVIKGLLTHLPILESVEFRRELTAPPLTVPYLEQLVQDPERFLTTELARLTDTIQRQLLHRDFIPGPRAVLGMDSPIHPTPVTKIIRECHPEFMTGLGVDAQGLAYSVLTGLVPPCDYDDVCTVFEKEDSEIGIRVFVPISGKSQEENEVMRKARGWVNWPHIAWAVVRALRYMDTPRSRWMAEQQRQKLVALGSCAEWYALGPVAGGDLLQGWSASGVIDSL